MHADSYNNSNIWILRIPSDFRFTADENNKNSNIANGVSLPS